MRFAFLVAWREYLEHARTKGFWLGMLMVPAILFLSVQIPLWLETKGSPTRYYVLVDRSETLAPVVAAHLEASYQDQVREALRDYVQNNVASTEPSASLPSSLASGGLDRYLEQLRPQLKPGAPPFKSPRRDFQSASLPAEINREGDLPSLAQGLRAYLRGDKKMEVDGQWVSLSAAILIPRDLEQQIVRPQKPAAPGTTEAGGIQYWSDNLADTQLRQQIERVVNTEIRRREYLLRGMDAAAIREVEQTYAPFTSLNPKKESGQESVNQGDVIRQWAPSGFVYLLWIAIFAISQMLLHNIIEEKSNRIIEVLLSSVTPGELMMGKLLGIAAIGLTMVGAWLLALFGILLWKSGGAQQLTGPMLTVLTSTHLIPMFIVYFLLGYLLYAAAILALGSVCNTLKEAQSYMAVITMIMMVPMMTISFIPKDPNGVLARVLSWIPFYTPFTMMNRAMADPPWIDVIGTLILLLVSTAGTVWLAGRIFRIGILRTGQPPRLLELFRWFRS